MKPNDNIALIEPIKVQSNSRIYVFVELCERGTLRSLLKPITPASEALSLKVFVDLVSGYQVLFDSHIIHEDIKP